MSTLVAWCFLFVAVLFNTLGNLFLKKAAISTHNSMFEVLASPIFLLGAFLFGMNLLAYTHAQSKLDVSVAYPVLVGLSMLGVSVGASLYFRESIGPVQIAGMVAIILGVGLISFSASSL